MPASVNSPPENPLKKLRTIIGLPQQEFAELLGFGWDMIRAVEIGRRGLTEERLAQIRASIGAVWDPPSQEWHFDPGGFSGRRKPYAREHFETFRIELQAEARQRAEIIYYLMLKTYFFSASIPDAAFNSWFWRLEKQFDRWSEEFGLKHKIEVSLEPLWDAEQSRTVGFRKFFPTLLNGEGDEEVFGKVIEDARKQRLETIAALYPRAMGKVFSKSDLLKSPEEQKPRQKRQKKKIG